MNHQFNVAEDFLLDDSFLRFCIGVNENDVAYWEKWISENPDKRPVFDQACRMFAIINGQQGKLDVEVNKFRTLLQQHIDTTAPEAAPNTSIRYMTRWRAAAAVLLLAAGSAAWFYYNGKKATTPAPAAIAKNDVLPGGAKASLVMGDGTAISLDSLNEQGLKEKDGTRIGNNNGKLVYDVSGTSGDKVTFNTLSTPRGGEYQLVLPDGSKVWLNAASSLRFPTRFTGADRTVVLTGEAYFEVAANATQPFQVQLNNGLKVAVLGTAFNVMAYDDEKTVNTTLVSGKVKVGQQNGNNVLLQPSEQAVLTKNNQQLQVSEADIDKAISWKMGTFEFDDDDLASVMRQLSRWYDVNVKFTGPVPDKHYTGSIRKQATLSQALQILKTAGVQFNIEGKQIIVEAK